MSAPAATTPRSTSHSPEASGCDKDDVKEAATPVLAHFALDPGGCPTPFPGSFPDHGSLLIGAVLRVEVLDLLAELVAVLGVPEGVF
jgi:hypothetical protein